MPELPEVEVVRRGLSGALHNQHLRLMIVRDRRLRWPVQADIEQILAGQQLHAVERRAKYLLLRFDQGTLISHLGMSGTWRMLYSAEPVRAHDHVDLIFDELVLRYNDPRRFGSLHWWPDNTPLTSHPLLSRLGIEPLDDEFDGRHLYQCSRGRQVPVKQFLLAGHAVVGVGNIYCSEALFRAGIRPSVAAGRIALRRYERLAHEIRATLAESIERGGSSLRDFVGSHGELGEFQTMTRVYGRAGEPCPNCSRPIRMLRQQQRATFFCPNCQR